MLPQVYTYPNMGFPYLNLNYVYQIPPFYGVPYPQKPKSDKACQFPEDSKTETLISQDGSTTLLTNQEDLIEQELRILIEYLSKNISLLKDTQFDAFINEKLQNLNLLFKDVPNIIKRRYIQVNKTKEEMTKFIIRRCFLFIKQKINYIEKDHLGAEEREKDFYHTFFKSDKEFLDTLTDQTIDDMIPFRRDSKLKTINGQYLQKLFESQRFCYYFKQFIDQFHEICLQENQEKTINMAKSILKIIISRDFTKIKTYRRFPWKVHELSKCEQRATEIYYKYSTIPNPKKHIKFESKQESNIYLIEKYSEPYI